MQILSLVTFLRRCSCTLQINVKLRMIIIDFISAPSLKKRIIFMTIILLVTDLLRNNVMTIILHVTILINFKYG